MSEITASDLGILRSDLHFYENSAAPGEKTRYLDMIRAVHAVAITKMKTLRE